MKRQAVPSRSVWLIVTSVVAIVFGLLSIREGGAVLFGDGLARTAAGHYVPFIVWFNFAAGFAYVAAGLALWWRRPLAVWLATTIAVCTVAAFALLSVLIMQGDAYEMRTVTAMVLRSVLWTGIAIAVWKGLGRLPLVPAR